MKCQTIFLQFFFIYFFSASLASSNTYAGVMVVINPSVDVGLVTKKQIANLFLAKTNSLPSGIKLKPIDQEEGEEPRLNFYSLVANKDASQLNAYWSRLIFTGKGQPPKSVLDDDEVMEIIASDNSFIGYISSEAANETVKIIWEEQ